MATVQPSLPIPPLSTSSFLKYHGNEKKGLGRELGPNELSYFLPSRSDGVNDMYLHLGFCAPERLVRPERVHAVWAVQRLRHPLLAAHIISGPDTSSASFEYTHPETVDNAIQSAANESNIRTSTKDDLLASYLNGPRLLSSSRTSFLILARDPESESGDNWHLLLCAMHCIGDGMALHACANEMLLLFGQGDGVDELREVVALELEKLTDIPRSMETALPPLSKGLKSVAAMVDDKLLAKKQIGGQAFPKTKGLVRKTIVLTISFDTERTKRILARCKAHGVSVSNAVFALCNIAWARMLVKGVVTTESGPKSPSLIYTALNTRPWLDSQSKSESFFRLCIGYFNVILPSFLSSDPARTFWHRARLAKSQSTKAVKSPFILARTHITAHKRAEQSIKWAKFDDQAAQEHRSDLPTPTATPKAESSTALIGLSLLGNLDGTYKHEAYGDVRLHTLTTGSRQRAGAMLLFSYTFVGRLWLCFGYDENGFADGVVETFWKEVLEGVDEFLGF